MLGHVLRRQQKFTPPYRAGEQWTKGLYGLAQLPRAIELPPEDVA